MNLRCRGEQQMREEEAILILQEQLLSEHGFLSLLKQGLGIDYSQLELIHEALVTIKEIWRDRSNVPKKAVEPLIGILSTISSSVTLYKGRENEIEDLGNTLREWIDPIFFSDMLRPSEEEAIGIVRSQLLGPNSLATELYLGRGIDNNLLTMTYNALDTLEKVWKDRETVSKVAIGAMYDVYEAIWSCAGIYHDDEIKQAIKTLAEELSFKVKHCVTDAEL